MNKYGYDMRKIQNYRISDSCQLCKYNKIEPVMGKHICVRFNTIVEYDMICDMFEMKNKTK